jgi:hypothetical protein
MVAYLLFCRGSSSLGSVNLGNLRLNFSMNYELPTMNDSATRRSPISIKCAGGVKKSPIFSTVSIHFSHFSIHFSKFFAIFLQLLTFSNANMRVWCYPILPIFPILPTTRFELFWRVLFCCVPIGCGVFVFQDDFKVLLIYCAISIYITEQIGFGRFYTGQ